MENNENLVVEQTAENVEQTTEETPKYTEAEFNAKLDEVLGKKIARREAKIRKEFERKYGDLEEVLKAGTGKESVDDLADTFRGFYESKGISVPKKKTEYSDSDIELLAKADAEAIISGGFDEVLEEADRLNALGAERMTPREKALFVTLTNHIKDTETGRELSELGVTEDVYGSKEFKDFAAKFNPKTPMRDIYDIYAKTQPKKEIKTMGSMKNTASAESAVKDFYTPEEARKFTKKDFDNNPASYEAVLQSMQKWK
jgi:hypothetical protein